MSGKGYRHERSVGRRKSAVSVVWNLGSDRGYPTLLGKVAADQARLVLQSMEAADRPSFKPAMRSTCRDRVNGRALGIRNLSGLRRRARASATMASPYCREVVPHRPAGFRLGQAGRPRIHPGEDKAFARGEASPSPGVQAARLGTPAAQGLSLWRAATFSPATCSFTRLHVAACAPTSSHPSGGGASGGRVRTWPPPDRMGRPSLSS